MLDSQAQAIVDHWLDNGRFCRESLTISNKNGRIVPLIHTPAQKALAKQISRQERLGKPVRGIVLKARRVHISAAICAQAFNRIPFFPHNHGLLAAHQDISATANYQYIKHFDNSYRDGCGYLGIVLPKCTRSNAEGMAWENGSDIRIATAGNVDFSRGGTSFQFAHLTEFAFWQNAEATMRGLGQSVPSVVGTYEFIESSANGMGGLFYEMWMDAQRRDSDRFALFFSWWEHPEYRMKTGDPAKFQDSLTPSELALQIQYQLTLEQICWRRWCIANQCQRSEITFHQEYPSCPEESFLTSGRPRFDMISIGKQPVQRNPLTGSLSLEQVGLKRQVLFSGREDGYGEVQIWRQPEKGRNYVIGADVASGRDLSAMKGGASDPDFSVAQVLDTGTGEQVSSFRERWTPGKFAELLYVLGAFYNWAYLIPERNNHGSAVIENLMRMKYPTERIWLDTGRAPFDRRPPILQELGYVTSNLTKPLMISHLDDALREQTITIHKANTIAELRAFVTKSDATMGGQGAHDDEVLSLALAVMGIMRGPQVFASTVEVAKQIEAEDHAEMERYGAPHRRTGADSRHGASRWTQ